MFKLVFRWFGSAFFFEEQPFRIIEYICPDNKVCVHSHNWKFPLKNSETKFDAKRSFLDKILGTCKICSLWKFFKCSQTRIFHLVDTTNIQSRKYKCRNTSHYICLISTFIFLAISTDLRSKRLIPHWW